MELKLEQNSVIFVQGPVKLVGCVVKELRVRSLTLLLFQRCAASMLLGDVREGRRSAR